MKRTVLGMLGLGLACTACCLPFMGTALAAIGLSSMLAWRVGGISLEYIVCEYGPWVAAAGALGVAGLIVHRIAARGQCDCSSTCTPGQC